MSTKYLKTVGDIRKAIEGLSDDLPLLWIVDDSDCRARNATNIPQPVTASEEHFKPEERGEEDPLHVFAFFVG